MNILVIGSGGREHALAWKCAQADRVNHVYVAPGNAGTSLEPKVKNITLDVLDFPALAQFAEENEITLTIVGPEAPLVEGIVDFFQEKGLPCFGPSRAAAQLEGSKAFSKDFLKRHGIPTAAFETFTDTAYWQHAKARLLQKRKHRPSQPLKTCFRGTSMATPATAW